MKNLFDIIILGIPFSLYYCSYLQSYSWPSLERHYPAQTEKWALDGPEISALEDNWYLYKPMARGSILEWARDDIQTTIKWNEWYHAGFIFQHVYFQPSCLLLFSSLNHKCVISKTHLYYYSWASRQIGKDLCGTGSEKNRKSTVVQNCKPWEDCRQLRGNHSKH